MACQHEYVKTREHTNQLLISSLLCQCQLASQCRHVLPVLQYDQDVSYPLTLADGHCVDHNSNMVIHVAHMVSR